LLSNRGRIDLQGIPPRALVATIVQFAVVCPAQGDGKLVADLAPERARFGKAEVMRF
jgi:hypothetical protein